MPRTAPAAMALLLCGCHARSPGGYKAGDSMLPTIAVGERIAVSPFDGAPARGRVIVFRAPEAPDREYVKRVVGLPGDTLAVNGTEIVLNGASVPRCRVGPWSYTDAGGAAHGGELWLEALDGARWLVFHDASAAAVPTGPWTVAPGEVFVLGDNRENSHDSRLWFGGKGGGLPFRLIVGGAPPSPRVALPPGAEGNAPGLDACAASLER